MATRKRTLAEKREKIKPPKYTTDEFMSLSLEEQKKEFRKLGRRLNERMRQIERAGVEEVPGYRSALETIEWLNKALKREKSGSKDIEHRFPEAFTGASKRLIRRAYVKMVNATEYTTLLLPYAKQYVSEVGAGMLGQAFTFEDYAKMPKAHKKRYWETFNKLQEAAPYYFREKGEGSGDALKIYNQILTEKGKKYFTEGSKNFMEALEELQNYYFKYTEEHAPAYTIEIPENRGKEFWF